MNLHLNQVEIRLMDDDEVTDLVAVSDLSLEFDSDSFVDVQDIGAFDKLPELQSPVDSDSDEDEFVDGFNTGFSNSEMESTDMWNGNSAILVAKQMQQEAMMEICTQLYESFPEYVHSDSGTVSEDTILSLSDYGSSEGFAELLPHHCILEQMAFWQLDSALFYPGDENLKDLEEEDERFHVYSVAGGIAVMDIWHIAEDWRYEEPVIPEWLILDGLAARYYGMYCSLSHKSLSPVPLDREQN